MSWRRRMTILSIGLGAALVLSSCSQSYEPFPSNAWLVGVKPDGEDEGVHFLAFDPEKPDLTTEIGVIEYGDLSLWGDHDADPSRVTASDGALSVSLDNQWHVDHNYKYIPEGILVEDGATIPVYPITAEYQEAEPADIPITNIPDDVLQLGESHLMAASFEQTTEHPHHLIVSVTNTQPNEPSETKSLPVEGSTITHWRFDVESPNSEPEEVVVEPEYAVSDSRPYWRPSDGYPVSTRVPKANETATTSYGETFSRSEWVGKVWAQLNGDDTVYRFTSPEVRGSDADAILLETQSDTGPDQEIVSQPVQEAGNFEIEWVKPPYELQSDE